MQFIQRIRAKASTYLPVVLSKREISELLQYVHGVYQIMFHLMYGSGMRHRECRNLRMKDVCFDTHQIIVRNGKGQQDRITVLPRTVVAALQLHMRHVEALHHEDVLDGLGRVYLPYALQRKYPNADRELGWQFVFPSRQLSKDPRSGVVRRHHLHESSFATAMRKALRRTSITKTSDSSHSASFLCHPHARKWS